MEKLIELELGILKSWSICAGLATLASIRIATSSDRFAYGHEEFGRYGSIAALHRMSIRSLLIEYKGAESGDVYTGLSWRRSSTKTVYLELWYKPRFKFLHHAVLELPSNFQTPVTVMSSFHQIDCSAFLNGSDKIRQRTAAAVDEALMADGCCYLINHGISLERVDQCFRFVCPFRIGRKSLTYPYFPQTE